MGWVGSKRAGRGGGEQLRINSVSIQQRYIPFSFFFVGVVCFVLVVVFCCCCCCCLSLGFEFGFFGGLVLFWFGLGFLVVVFSF